MVMLRCSLQVMEVSELTTGFIDYRRLKIILLNSKGTKVRTTRISYDAAGADLVSIQKLPGHTIDRDDHAGQQAV